MPAFYDKINLDSKFLKRNVKMLPCQKEMAKFIYEGGETSIRAIARMFKVDKRTIQFLLFPERHEKNLADRQKRGGSKRYYDRGRNTEAQASIRKYKKELFFTKKEE